MLSESDTRAIQRCRDVLNDLRATARSEVKRISSESDNAVLISNLSQEMGELRADAATADTALLNIVRRVDTYLDRVANGE